MTSMDRTQYNFVGIDLHKMNHVAILCNCFGEPIKTFTIKNSPNYFPKFLENVLKASKDKAVIFGLEDVNFYGRSLAKFLIDQNQQVKEVNSAWTKKRRNAGINKSKTDKNDAHLICKNLINELDSMPTANPVDFYMAVRQTLTSRNHYIQMITSLKNSIHNMLIHHYANYTDFFKDFESRTARGFFIKYPSPDLLQGVSQESLQKYLKEFNRSAPKDLSAKILKAVEKNGWMDTGYQEERNMLIKTHLENMENLIGTVKDLESKLEVLVGQSDYPLKSIPGIDTVLAATLIASIGDINRFSNSGKLAKLAGIAPYEHSSGQSVKKYSNKLGNRELHKAFYAMTLTHIRKEANPIMYEYYQKKIAEGRKKKQAMVCVMRRLVNIVYSVMKHKRPYEQPTRCQDEQNSA
ncbi:IS110 family transposase [Heliorestis convoluta]|uniref:Transposase domain protein n=1 Tax=Heliorestis convoluta TaxID=356322 RepID=A0A5Q2N4R4_9FIRM|nr:IS110 family transposase [Heliorestis convoluta]QGG48879.1 transposase domain protein [Heliorestis convoluta]